MTIEQVNAVVAVLTLLVVALASIAALVQLRHLRGANTLSAMLEILREWQDPRFQDDLRYARIELPRRMADPEFVETLRRRLVDRTLHRELFIADWYEQVGSYLKHRLLDETIFLDVACASTSGAWVACWPAIAVMREAAGDSLYENFEYLAASGRAADARLRIGGVAHVGRRPPGGLSRPAGVTQGTPRGAVCSVSPRGPNRPRHSRP